MSGAEETIKANNRQKGESPFGQPMDVRLPVVVHGLLSEASSQLETLQQDIQSATSPNQVIHSLSLIHQVREVQKNAVRLMTAFHEKALSLALSSYDARIDTVQGKIIKDDSLPEAAKSAKLTDSANNLKKDKHAISHVKHAVHAFQAQIQNLATAREHSGDMLDKLVLDLANAPAQPDKLPAVKAYATELLQAEKCLFTTICNELAHGHFTVATAYNKDNGPHPSQPATSFYQSSYFQVPPLNHSLLEESKAYIKSAFQLDQQYCLTASSLLSYAEGILQAQKHNFSQLGKSGELHFKESQTKVKSLLANGIKHIGQFSANLKNTQASLVGHTPAFTTAVTSVLQATHALEKVGNYASKLQASDPHHQILTSRKQRTMQQLIGGYYTALTDAERITSAVILYQPTGQDKHPFQALVSTTKHYIVAAATFLYSLFSRKKAQDTPPAERKEAAPLAVEPQDLSVFMHRQTNVSGPILSSQAMQDLLQEAIHPLINHANQNMQEATPQPQTHSGRILHAREQGTQKPGDKQR